MFCIDSFTALPTRLLRLLRKVPHSDTLSKTLSCSLRRRENMPAVGSRVLRGRFARCIVGVKQLRPVDLDAAGCVDGLVG